MEAPTRRRRDTREGVTGAAAGVAVAAAAAAAAYGVVLPREEQSASCLRCPIFILSWFQQAPATSYQIAASQV